jgi:hypothetical protein
MKSKFILMVLILLSVTGCEDKQQNKSDALPDTTETTSDLRSLKGTWELTGFYNYNDNVVVDSFDMNPDFRQIKMYSDKKVMWCKHKSADSSDWFGYGTYVYDGDRLTEILDFGSTVMNEVIADKKEFIFELNLTEDHFEQIELDEEGNRIYSENYRRVE